MAWFVNFLKQFDDNHNNLFCVSGTKNVAKQMKKISCGTQETEGKSWFPELSDKCKIHFILSMTFVAICCVHTIRQKYQSPFVLLYEELCSVCHKA